jgi:hypothetical protein
MVLTAFDPKLTLGEVHGKYSLPMTGLLLNAQVYRAINCHPNHYIRQSRLLRLCAIIAVYFWTNSISHCQVLKDL